MNKVFLAISVLILIQLISAASAVTISSFTINDTNAYTNSPILDLDISSDAAQMKFSCDSTNWTALEAYSPQKTFDLSAQSAVGCTTTDGQKTVHVKAYAADLNEETSATANDSITLDTAKPTGTITINDNSGYTNTNTPALTLSATDNDGIKEMAFSCTGTAWSAWIAYSTNYNLFNIETGDNCVPGDGNKTVYVKFKDNAGNESAAPNASDSTYLDRIAPSTPTNFTATGGTAQVILNWYKNLEADLNGYYIYYSQTDNSANTLLKFMSITDLNTYTHSNLNWGTTYYYKIKAEDKAGNLSNASSIISAATTSDSTAPSVGTTTLSGFTIYNNYIKGTGTIVGGTATDSGSGTNNTTCEYTTDNGSSWNAGTWNSDHCEKTSFTISNGTNYTFNTRIKDVAGNTGTGTATSSYTGDTEVPKPSLTATAYSSRVELTWSAVTDSLSGVKEYYVKKNDEAWASNSTSTTYNFAGLTNGTLYNFKLKVVDNAGNETESDAVSATPTSSSSSGNTGGGGGSSDTTAPNLSWTFPADANYELKDYNITLKVNASDYDSGLAIIILSYKQSGQAAYTRITNITNPTDGTNSYKWELSSDMNSGTYELKAVARDEAGNVATKSINIKITLPTAVNPVKPAEDKNKLVDQNKTKPGENKNKSKETLGTAGGAENQLEGTAGKGEETTTNPFTGLASGLLKNILPVIGIIVVLVVIAFVAVKAKGKVGHLGRDDLVGVHARMETGLHGISSKPSTPGSKTLEIIKREIEAEHTGKFARK